MATSIPKPPSEIPAIRQVMMPALTNPHGAIFGGEILALIDQAAYVEARRQANNRYVTVAFNGVEFHRPVFVGDILSLYADAQRIGRTSITVKVRVEAFRPDEDLTLEVTTAEVVLVAVDSEGTPRAVCREEAGAG